MECPHLKQITKINNPFIKEGLILTNFECSVCRSKRNTWMCIHCGILNCDRYANDHANCHFKHKNHIIFIDCHSLSIYCYACDDFVINENCYKHFRKLRHILHRENSQLIRHIHNKVIDDDDNQIQKHKNKRKNSQKCQFKASGLRNLGNTCFMNAVLQSLCNIQLFSYYFKELPNSVCQSIENQDTLVTKELRKTILLLWEGGKSVISPESLFTVIWKIVPRFRGYQPQDAHEFLRYMLDRLHTELSSFNHNQYQQQHKIYSPNHNISILSTNNKSTMVTSIFGGILQNEVRCLICGNESRKHDPFFDLSLDIPQPSTQDSNGSNSNYLLTDCLSKFTELEELGETELYNCPTCKKKQRSSKKFWIRRLPNVLCLHLKRFKWSDCFRSKLDVHIRFPIKDLDMSPFILSNIHGTRNSCGSSLYDLAAIIVHHGNGVGSGHYTSYATHHDCWHHFNDSSVTICNEDTVMKSKAYILFYIRRQFVSINGST
uniref:Ubiquitin carboxyl-terminal hydrolase n=1 Tax=Dermatophagoides pteronyssinus TaxID=6956 RepID=A0A6P6XYD7_DERPT|nr:ubiquitin carboxyl-terminal hydrolase 3-like [Dermatophagoides pteronyssinus]